MPANTMQRQSLNPDKVAGPHDPCFLRALVALPQDGGMRDRPLNNHVSNHNSLLRKRMGLQLMKYVSYAAMVILALLPGVARAASPDGQGAPVAATSETPSDPLHFSANATLLSDYRFRGTSYSLGDPVTQASLVAAHESGLFAGVFASSLGNHPIYGTVEVDLFAGFATPIAPAIMAEVSLYYYVFPDGNLSVSQTNSFETLVQLTGDFGAFTPKLGVWYAWEQTALLGRDNVYLFGDLVWRVPDTAFDTKVHVGYTNGAYSIAADETVVDWSVGVGFRPVPNIRLGIDYSEIGGPQVNEYTDDAVVGSLSMDF